MHKYSCYIENTKEVREWLSSLEINRPKDTDDEGDFILVYYNEDLEIQCYETGSHLFDFVDINYDNVKDCTNNFPLFKALTAVRDDSDIKQWFTDGKVWILCMWKEFCKWYYSQSEYIDFSFDTIHKATDKELIEHFSWGM